LNKNLQHEEEYWSSVDQTIFNTEKDLYTGQLPISSNETLISELINPITENSNENKHDTTINNINDNNKEVFTCEAIVGNQVVCFANDQVLNKKDKAIIDRGKRTFFAIIEREKKSKIPIDELAVLVNIELNNTYF
jgi:hypothetical protein